LSRHHFVSIVAGLKITIRADEPTNPVVAVLFFDGHNDTEGPPDMTGHSTAKKEVYQRKVAVCERAAKDNFAATGDYGISPSECSDALIAAGLREIQSWTEWFSILYGCAPGTRC